MSILYLLSFETRGFCRLYIPIYLYCFIFSHLIAVIQVLPLITLGSFDFRPNKGLKILLTVHYRHIDSLCLQPFLVI